MSLKIRSVDEIVRQIRLELVTVTRTFIGSHLTTAVQPVATCRQSPYLHKPAILSLWRHSHYDV